MNITINGVQLSREQAELLLVSLSAYRDQLPSGKGAPAAAKVQAKHAADLLKLMGPQ